MGLVFNKIVPPGPSNRVVLDFKLVVTQIRASAQAKRESHRVRARYDAVTTDDNRRHWANADGLSPNASNSAEVRRILRNRARYETANNSYARGIVLTLAHDVVGTAPGYRCSLATLKPIVASNRLLCSGLVRCIFLKNSARCGWLAPRMANLLLSFTNNPRLIRRFSSTSALVEADQVTTPDLDRLSTMAVDGIVFDSAGIRSNTTSSVTTRGIASTRLAAITIASQRLRCCTGSAPTDPVKRAASRTSCRHYPLFAQLRRFNLAVLAAAETAADFAGILYTDAPANGEADAAEPFEPIELEKRALVTMPGGWKMAQMQAEQPSTDLWGVQT